MAQQFDPEKYKKLEESPEVSLTIRGDSTVKFDPEKYKQLEDETKKPPNLLLDAWRGLTTPIATIPGSTEEFREAHPYIAGVGDFGTGVLSSLTSPLNIATAGVASGEVAAASQLPRIARGLGLARKTLSAPIAAEGAINIAHPESSLSERFAGGLELIGGVAGLKAPRVPKPMVSDEVLKGSLIPASKPRVRMNANGTFQVLDDPQISPDAIFDAKGNRVDPIGKLKNALEESTIANKEQRIILKEERAEKIAQAAGATGEGREWAANFMSRLKGKHTKLEAEPLKLDQVDVEGLYNIIRDFGTEDEFIRAQSISGLGKLLRGENPVPSEINILNKVFGNELAETLVSKGKALTGKQKIIVESVNLPKAIMASWDMSAPMRQGLPLIHKKAWWTSWDDMVKSWGSEKAYRGVMDSIENDAIYGQALDDGVHFTDLKGISGREDILMSTWAEKVPGVRRSNRAYTAFLNKLRMDTYKSLVKDAERAGNFNDEIGKELAAFVNNASGRGSLGALEKHVVTLNSTLFSPRLVVSRIQMMNPANYVSGSPQVRKEYVKSILSLASAWTTMASLASVAGANVSLDTNSADFGKIRIGDARLDPAAGFQQYLVLASRVRPNIIGGGKFTTSTTGRKYELGKGFGTQTKGDVALNFLSNKLNPPAKFVWDMMFQNDYAGFNTADRTVQMFLPMFVQDIVEVYKEEPEALPFTIPASFFGVGTSAYGSSAPREGLIFNF